MSTTILPCTGCGALIDCQSLPDSVLYSLQDELLPFVFLCPSGFDCGNVDSISFLCCGEVFTAVLLSSMTTDQRTAAINRIASQCTILQATCGENPPGGATGDGTGPSGPDGPGTPQDPGFQYPYYYSARQTGHATCPDGSTYDFTVNAGRAAGPSQAAADALALAIANTGALAHRICLSDLASTFTCADVAYSQVIRATGLTLATDGTNTWQVASGTLPTGVTLTSTGGTAATLSGTPTTPGTYSFSMRVTAPNGDSNTKAYQIAVFGITNNPLPDATQDDPYSEVLTGAGSTAPFTFDLTGGTLPAGLTLFTDGTVAGTPTESGLFTFTVTINDEAGHSCSVDVDLDVAGGTCPDWSTLSWSYIIHPDGGSASTSAAGASGVWAVSGVGAGTLRPNITATGQLVYTGPGCDTNFHMDLTTLTGVARVQINIQQGATVLLFVAAVTPAGSYDFPFTVLAGAGDTIFVQVLAHTLTPGLAGASDGSWTVG